MFHLKFFLKKLIENVGIYWKKNMIVFSAFKIKKQAIYKEMQLPTFETIQMKNVLKQIRKIIVLFIRSNTVLQFTKINW